MKKIIALLLLVASVFTLASCDDGYEPVESTELEKNVVITMKIDDEVYEVKYELYRAFFLAYKTEIDGGDSSVWSGENKDEYIAKINEKIEYYIADIYSVLHNAKKVGIDVYSDEYDDAVKEAIADIVDGEIGYGGFDGDYDAYLAYLKSMYLNYSVQDLMMRYDMALSDINRYYAGYVKDTDTGEMEKGALIYDEADVSKFYYDESVSILMAEFNADYMEFSNIIEAKNNIYMVCGDHEAVYNKIIGVSSTAPGDVFQIVGKYNLDRLYYSEYTDAAFALSSGEISDLIKVSTSGTNYYYVLYRTRKDKDLYEANYSVIEQAYIENEIGKILYTDADEMIASAQYTSALATLDRAQISMEH